LVETGTEEAEFLTVTISAGASLTLN